MQAVTAAYNLMWGCKRYDYDADVELFINVIQVPRRFGTNIHKVHVFCPRKTTTIHTTPAGASRATPLFMTCVSEPDQMAGRTLSLFETVLLVGRRG